MAGLSHFNRFLTLTRSRTPESVAWLQGRDACWLSLVAESLEYARSQVLTQGEDVGELDEELREEYFRVAFDRLHDNWRASMDLAEELGKAHC